MMEMAADLIQRRSEKFDASQFKNHYAEALRDLVKSKLAKGQTVPVDENQEPAGKVIDFMEALKRSVAGKRKVIDDGEPAPSKARRVRAPQPEPPKSKRSRSA